MPALSGRFAGTEPDAALALRVAQVTNSQDRPKPYGLKMCTSTFGLVNGRALFVNRASARVADERIRDDMGCDRSVAPSAADACCSAVACAVKPHTHYIVGRP